MSTKQISPNDARISIESFGGPEVLAVHKDLPIPQPGPGEVRIRIEASSVQYTDTMIRRGKYPDLRDPAPITPGYDLVGLVDAVGPDVDEALIGKRVADLTTIGANARYALRPAAGLVTVPQSVDAGEATALVLSWMTAYQAIRIAGVAKPGDRVLVIGGNGAVGQAAIGLAQALDIEIWVTSSERHRASLQAMGAKVVPREGWLEQVQEAGGVDIVVDGVAADNFASAYAALRAGGRVIAIGMSAIIARGGGLPGIGWSLLQLYARHFWPNRKSGSLYSITKYRKAHPDHWQRDLSELFGLLERGEVHPAIADRITLDGVVEAHRRLERGGLSGKLILDAWA